MAESSTSVKKRGASDGDNETHIDDDDDDNNDGIDKQPKQASKKSKRSSADSDGQQDLLKVLQARVEKVERNMDDAKRELDEAKAELARVKADDASKEDIERADVVRIDKRLSAAETAALVKGTASGARQVPLMLNADVKARLSRPLDQWQAGETFDVAGVAAAIGADMWHDLLYLRAEGLAVLREWESKTPFLVVFGTPSIGKSTLLQLAAMRTLVLGNPVLLHVRGVEKLVQIVDDALLRVERLTLDDVGFGGRPSKEDTVMCYDSPNGFQATVGHADKFKKTLIVHSPSGDLNNTLKADKISPRFFPVPTEAELVALGALVHIDPDEVRRRIARYGPIIRYVFSTVVAERCVLSGIRTMVRFGGGLVDFYEAPDDVYDITLMQLKPNGVSDMYTFASDFIRDEVVRRVAQRQVVDLLRLVNAVDIHGSLRGQVFENRMLDMLCRANAKILFKTDGGDKVLRIAGDGVTLSKADGSLTLPASSVLQQRVLYRPPHSNNASWDALVVESDHVAYLLQMTVAKDHPVKQHGLAAGKSLLAKAGFQGEVRLVFLLPPAAFTDFRVPQTILNVDGAASLTTWSQEKWCVVEVDDVAFWPQPRT